MNQSNQGALPAHYRVMLSKISALLKERLELQPPGELALGLTMADCWVWGAQAASLWHSAASRMKGWLSAILETKQ